jgi:hypothetical protein
MNPTAKHPPRRQASTLSAAKHLPERWPTKITPHGKASVAVSGHDALCSKASDKEEANDNDGKASVKAATKRRPRRTTAKHPPKER